MQKSALDAFLSHYPESVLQTLNDCARSLELDIYLVGGALLFPSWSFLDYVGAAVVSIFILHAAIKIIWPGISELIDVGASEEINKKITHIALKNGEVQEIHALRTRYISSGIQVDMHIVVDGSMTVREGHSIADKVESRIVEAIPEVLDVVIHVDPPEAALNSKNSYLNT